MSISQEQLWENYQRVQQRTEILGESVTYTVPHTPKALMADFYMLSYIDTINFDKLAQKGNIEALRFEDDLKDDMEHARGVLYPFLKKHMLDALFYAMCAEIRHIFDNTPSQDIVEKYKGFLQSFHKYYHHYQMEFGGTDPRKPSSGTAYKEKNRGYADAYAAITKAIEKQKWTLPQTVAFFADAFLRSRWNGSYGGQAWSNIAKAWLDLASKKDNDFSRLAVAIDHIYDLQHNTGTVFNKLQQYYTKEKGYEWIKQMLDFKANIKSISELIPECSSQMVKLSRPILKAASQLNPKKSLQSVDNKTSIHNELQNEAKYIAAFSSLIESLMPVIIDMAADQQSPNLIGNLVSFYTTPGAEIAVSPGLTVICNNAAGLIREYIKYPNDTEHYAAKFFKLLGPKPYFGDIGRAFNKDISQFSYDDWHNLVAFFIINYPEISDIIKKHIYANAVGLGIEDKIYAAILPLQVTKTPSQIHWPKSNNHAGKIIKIKQIKQSSQLDPTKIQTSEVAAALNAVLLDYAKNILEGIISQPEVYTKSVIHGIRSLKKSPEIQNVNNTFIKYVIDHLSEKLGQSTAFKKTFFGTLYPNYFDNIYKFGDNFYAYTQDEWMMMLNWGVGYNPGIIQQMSDMIKESIVDAPKTDKNVPQGDLALHALKHAFLNNVKYVITNLAKLTEPLPAALANGIRGLKSTANHEKLENAFIQYVIGTLCAQLGGSNHSDTITLNFSSLPIHAFSTISSELGSDYYKYTINQWRILLEWALHKDPTIIQTAGDIVKSVLNSSKNEEHPNTIIVNATNALRSVFIHHAEGWADILISGGLDNCEPKIARGVKALIERPNQQNVTNEFIDSALDSLGDMLHDNIELLNKNFGHLSNDAFKYMFVKGKGLDYHDFDADTWVSLLRNALDNSDIIQKIGKSLTDIWNAYNNSNTAKESIIDQLCTVYQAATKQYILHMISVASMKQMPESTGSKYAKMLKNIWCDEFESDIVSYHSRVAMALNYGMYEDIFGVYPGDSLSFILPGMSHDTNNVPSSDAWLNLVTTLYEKDKQKVLAAITAAVTEVDARLTEYVQSSGKLSRQTKKHIANMIIQQFLAQADIYIQETLKKANAGNERAHFAAEYLKMLTRGHSIKDVEIKPYITAIMSDLSKLMGKSLSTVHNMFGPLPDLSSWVPRMKNKLLTEYTASNWYDLIVAVGKIHNFTDTLVVAAGMHEKEITDYLEKI